jgi:hypothetical protein
MKLIHWSLPVRQSFFIMKRIQSALSEGVILETGHAPPDRAKGTKAIRRRAGVGPTAIRAGLEPVKMPFKIQG